MAGDGTSLILRARIQGGGAASGAPTPPLGFIFLVDSDGYYLTDSDGYYLVEAI